MLSFRQHHTLHKKGQHFWYTLPVAGFTLIELMVTVAMVAILAAIAVPSYRQYAIKNAEAQTQARMKQLEIELERWRGKALTYKGFKPIKLANNGTATYGYDETDNTTIYVPINSTSSNYQYKITLASVSATTPTSGSTTTTTMVANSLVTTNATIDDTSLAVGRNWAMLATPNTDKFPNAKKLLLNSTGVQCKTKNSDNSITITSLDCGTDTEKW